MLNQNALGAATTW